MTKALQCWYSYLHLTFHGIQQQERESLAAYVHWFKTEAKRCNYTNDAATIRIFIKGLKNAHSLATCMYEKGPQTLSAAISKVEKLNAVQQLTSMIIPPSTVNIMSNDEDHCFQCQEQGHIARNCPNIRCFKCDEYCHIVMDCPHRIPPLGILVKHHQARPHRSHPNRSSSRHHHEDRDWGSHSRSQSHFHIHCSSSHHDSYRGHSKSWHRDNCSPPGVAHNAYIPYIEITVIDPTTAHYTDLTADHPHTEVPQLTTPQIIVDHIHIHLTNPHGKFCIGHTHTSANHEANHTTRRTWEWK